MTPAEKQAVAAGIAALEGILSSHILDADSAYGFFCGGDPRYFVPDEESCTIQEIENHKQACAAWERGEGTPADIGGWSDDGSAHITKAPFGIGTHTIDDCKELRETACAALAKLRALPAEEWRPWSQVTPVLGKSVIAWREDAGSFEAVYRLPLKYCEELQPEPRWFSAGGEDLTGDLPSLFTEMPVPESIKTNRGTDE